MLRKIGPVGLVSGKMSRKMVTACVGNGNGNGNGNGSFGWQASFVDCFVIYLAGHNRPVHEVLFPKIKPLEPTFTNEFAGMTRDVIELDTLLQLQVRLIDELPKQLTAAHRNFLLSLVQGDPAWDLMPTQHLRELQALKWKLTNLAKLKKSNAKRFAAQHQMLAERFAQHAGSATAGIASGNKKALEH